MNKEDNAVKGRATRIFHQQVPVCVTFDRMSELVKHKLGNCFESFDKNCVRYCRKIQVFARYHAYFFFEDPYERITKKLKMLRNVGYPFHFFDEEEGVNDEVGDHCDITEKHRADAHKH